jgi:hypothetical protein
VTSRLESKEVLPEESVRLGVRSLAVEDGVSVRADLGVHASFEIGSVGSSEGTRVLASETKDSLADAVLRVPSGRMTRPWAECSSSFSEETPDFAWVAPEARDRSSSAALFEESR